MDAPKRIDAATQKAARAFIRRLGDQYDLAQALLYGSRARNTHRPDSDADLALVLRGPHGRKFDAVRVMSGIAFDVMLETGILIQPAPIWEDEWQHPEHFGNTEFIENIQREGIRL